MKNYLLKIVLMLLSMLWMLDPIYAQKRPEPLFELKTKKDIREISLIGEKEDYILITNREDIFVYNAQNGRLVWKDVVPNFDEAGLDLIWKDSHYIISTKKGMRGYEIASGKMLWETKTPINMRDFSRYYNFSNCFVLNLNRKLSGYESSTGQIFWTCANLDWNNGMQKENIPVIYDLTRSFGDRIVVLGDKVTQIIDVSNGQLLAKVEIKYNPKNRQPVSLIGDNAVVLCGKEITKAMDLRDGRVLWSLPEEIDCDRDFVTLFHDSTNFVLFSFSKCLALYNLDTGEAVWETGEDVTIAFEQAHLYDDGTLLILGTKNQVLGTNSGNCAYALGLDFLTGQVKFFTPVAFSKSSAQTVIDPLKGNKIKNRIIVMECDFEYPGGALIYHFGTDVKKMGEANAKWNLPGGEGLALLDPATGALKWRADYLLFENWEKTMSQVMEQTSNSDPGSFSQAKLTPPFHRVNDFAYINANNTIVKIDLTSGQLAWQGPTFGYVNNFLITQERVFGEIGRGFWSFTFDTIKIKTDDVITKTKNCGYFILDDSTGAQLWKADKADPPLTLFLHKYVESSGAVLLADGRFLRKLDVVMCGYNYQDDLKKNITGEIGAGEGVVFALSSVNTAENLYYTNYTISPKDTMVISMEHGLFLLPDTSVLVLAAEGPAVVATDGAVRWKTGWDWKQYKTNFIPKITHRGVLFPFKGRMKYVAFEDGSVIWESKESVDKSADLIMDKSRKRLFLVEGKNVSVYKL